MVAKGQKKLCRLILLQLILPLIVSAQQGKPVQGTDCTDSIKNIFVQLYDAGKGGALYEMCDTEFKKSFPRQDFIHWLGETRKTLGVFLQSKRTEKSGTFIIYRSYFQNANMDFLLAVNISGEITGLAFQPIKKNYQVPGSNPLANTIDSMVEKAVRPYIQRVNTVGICIGIIDRGKYYRYGYGETVKNNHLIPNGNTIFEIGSITKTFTASLLAELIIHRKCQLGASLSQCLIRENHFRFHNLTAVTLEMLANHTSGLPRIPSNLFSTAGSAGMEDPYQNYDSVTLFKYLDTLHPEDTPGIKFGYSNLGYGLLGTVLEKISGHTYEQILEEYICDPLKMADTRTALNRTQQKNFAQGYKLSGEPTGHWHFKALKGCGAIRSSVNDLLKYLDAHVSNNGKTDLEKSFRLCEQPTFPVENGKIGLGWFIPEGLPDVYWHNGGTGGFSSYCAYNLDKKVAVIILSNSSDSVDKLGVELIRALSMR